MTASTNFAGTRNADWRAELQIVSGGAPVDLAGADLRMDVVSAAGEKQLRLRIGSGITVTHAAQGRLAIAVSRAGMFGLSPGIYAYDMLLERGGSVQRILAGAFKVEQGVTDV